MMTTNCALQKKLLKIMDEVEYIQKDGYNKFHKYNFISEEKMVSVIRAKLIEHGVYVFANQLGFDMTEKGGDKGWVTTVKVEYTVVDVESGGSFTSVAFGAGEDKGDKGLYKAMTGANKYFFMKNLLQLPTGDDPEATDASGNPTAPTAPPATTQRAKPPTADERKLANFKGAVRKLAEGGATGTKAAREEVVMNLLGADGLSTLDEVDSAKRKVFVAGLKKALEEMED